jgi:hypothetical protein
MWLFGSPGAPKNLHEATQFEVLRQPKTGMGS